jgi:hypothetical protein
MHGLILAAILFLSTHGYQTEPQQTDLRCEFNVVQQVGPPLIAGPLDLVSRVRVLSQPGSPVAILMVDVTGTQITVEKDRSKYDSAFLAEVQNVSDRPLSNILVQMNVEIGNSGGGDGGGSGTELLPGQTVRITSRGAGSSQGPQRSGEDERPASAAHRHADGCCVVVRRRKVCR